MEPVGEPLMSVTRGQCDARPTVTIPATVSAIIDRFPTCILSQKSLMTRLVAHVTKSPNYNRLQSAYRRGHSSETALLKLLNDVYCAADNGFRTMLLQLDQSAAFDTIDMSTLLRRLRFTFGISGPALNWTASLPGRSTTVSSCRSATNV